MEAAVGPPLYRMDSDELFGALEAHGFAQLTRGRSPTSAQIPQPATTATAKAGGTGPSPAVTLGGGQSAVVAAEGAYSAAVGAAARAGAGAAAEEAGDGTRVHHQQQHVPGPANSSPLLRPTACTSSSPAQRFSHSTQAASSTPGSRQPCEGQRQQQRVATAGAVPPLEPAVGTATRHAPPRSGDTSAAGLLRREAARYSLRQSPASGHCGSSSSRPGSAGSGGARASTSGPAAPGSASTASLHDGQRAVTPQATAIARGRPSPSPPSRSAVGRAGGPGKPGAAAANALFSSPSSRRSAVAAQRRGEEEDPELGRKIEGLMMALELVQAMVSRAVDEAEAACTERGGLQGSKTTTAAPAAPPAGSSGGRLHAEEMMQSPGPGEDAAPPPGCVCTVM